MSSVHPVQKGETLAGIAQAHGRTLGELLKANPQFIQNGRSPDLIYAGDQVTIPDESAFDKNADLTKGIKHCPVDKALEGEVIEVTFQSGIKVARDRKPIAGPHWKQGTNVHEDPAAEPLGSQRAAVYLINGKGGSQALEVKVKITVSKNVSGNATLEGKLGGLDFSGICPTAAGPHTVACTIKKLPDAIRWSKGDVGWRLNVPDLRTRITLKNTTRLEVFNILATPAAFYKLGVWVEALRFLCGKVAVTGEKKDQPVICKIAAWCHGRHSLRYDTVGGGGSAYGVRSNGGTFNLKDYLKHSLPVVNCADQAGAVQSLAGALGIAAVWCFQCPSPKVFGFIKKTKLIGVPGQCNNPFFVPDPDPKKHPQLLADTDPNRTSFAWHAFAELTGKIVDACAGPHLATESPAQYLAASVDVTETKRRGKTPGEAADMTHPGGVTDLV